MVNLTRIYTHRRRRRDPARRHERHVEERPAAGGLRDVDEANAHLGVALALRRPRGRRGDGADHVQNDLFDVGADFCTPIVPDPKYPPLRIEQEYVDRLEAWCDHYNEDLPDLRSFILNGGTLGAPHPARRAHRRTPRGAGRVGGVRRARGR